MGRLTEEKNTCQEIKQEMPIVNRHRHNKCFAPSNCFNSLTHAYKREENQYQ